MDQLLHPPGGTVPQSIDFSHVTGGDPDLLHEGVIGEGNEGAVHQVVIHSIIAYIDTDFQL
jgi:hypothetical protein